MKPTIDVLVDTTSALNRIERAGKRLRDLVEHGTPPCIYGPPHGVFGEEATAAVIEWDRAIRGEPPVKYDTPDARPEDR